MNRHQYSYFGEQPEHITFEDLDFDALSEAGSVNLLYELTDLQIEMGLASGPTIVIGAVNGYLSSLLTEQEAPDARTADRTLKKVERAATTLDEFFRSEDPTLQRLGASLLPVAYNTEHFRIILSDVARRARENQELVSLGSEGGGRPRKLARRFYLQSLFRAWCMAGGTGRGIDPQWEGNDYAGPFYRFAKAVFQQLLKNKEVAGAFPTLKYEIQGLGAACFDVAKEWEHFDYWNPESVGGG